MERLTEWYDDGLREGVLVKEKRGEKEIKVLFEEVDDGYHAMCTLKAYEDTGLTPEQIQEIDHLYAEKCREVIELRQKKGKLADVERGNLFINDMLAVRDVVTEIHYMNDRWIPIEKRLPEDNYYILLSFANLSLPLVGRYEKDSEGGAFYLGDCDEQDTCASMNLFVNAWMHLPEPYRPESNEIVRDENEEGGLNTFQLLRDVEKEMSKEERKQVMIENAINLKTMCDYVVSCSYLDIVLIICMLRDYVQMVDEIRTDDIQWSVYYRNKFLKMADKFSEQIEYDYDAAKERCLKRQQKEENAGDIGEDAMTLAVKYGKGKKKKEKESGDEK